MSSDLSAFPTRLRQFRKEYGYRIHEVARMMDVSISTICAYENGTRMPQLPGLVKLAELYHCTTDYLLGMNDEKPDTDGVTIKINALKQRLQELEESIQKTK